MTNLILGIPGQKGDAGPQGPRGLRGELYIYLGTLYHM